MMRQLVLATRNLNKVREIKTLLKGIPLAVISLRELPDPPAVEEDQPTYAGNALKKAAAAAAVAGRDAIVMADDSGLEVEALDSLPGVRAARFAGPGAGDAANNRLLLEKLSGLPPEKRGATFRCAIALFFPDGETCLVEESCSGRIAGSPRGEAGFGYDPLFIYEPAGLTFAEMGEEAKNKVSHRGKALRRARLALEHWLER
jgi:XTP/dITP diphosphohydrolase